MEIIPYSQEHFEALVAFLRKNWSANHAVYDRELFDWQYAGSAPDCSCGFLLLDEDESLKGFLGTICYPFLYKGAEKNAAGLAIWVTDMDIRNSGAGIYLKKAVEDNNDVVYTIGLNRSIAHFYQKSNYAYYDSLYRYVAPLDAEKYQRFLKSPCAPGEIELWAESICFGAPALPADNFDANMLAGAYKANIAPYFSLLPQKDAAFWDWRYLRSKGFKYFFYQGIGGIIIFRVEETYAPGDRQRHGLKCLRIIEIIPADGKVWSGESDSDLAGTLSSLLSRAKEDGCVLADFQISNSRLGHILLSAGFRLQQNDGIANIAHLFSPYRADASALNFVYRVSHKGAFASVDREDTYLLKSDTDMDRPNFLS